MNIDTKMILNAQKTILGIADNTPLVPSYFISNLIQEECLLKLENMQAIGSFKIRGAMNAIYNLPSNIKVVTCCSTGNHGRGISYAATKKGIKAVIFMSTLVPKVKIEAIKSLGAEVVLCGRNQVEAELACQKFAKENGYIEISPFDDPYVISGQGTIGLELLAQRSDVKSILIPLSGGGLAAGIAIAIKKENPNIKIFGITMENGAAMHMSLRQGRPIDVTESPSLADALGGGIGKKNRYTFTLCKKFLDTTITVSESEIYNAMQTLYFEDRIIAEGSCVVGVAALLAKKIPNLKGPIATIITGRNVDMSMFTDIINGNDIKLGDTVLKGQCYKSYNLN